MNYTILLLYIYLLAATLSFYKHNNYWNVISFSANSQVKGNTIKKQ